MKEKAGTEVGQVRVKRSLIAKMAEERGVEAADFYSTVTETMFKGANKSQLMTLLLVADRYHLDVTTKEIYAFPAQGGGIVPVVSIDGWISLAHQHPMYDGEEFRYSDKMTTPTGGKACPEWMEIVVYRKDTAHPTVIREYLEECYRKTAPWQSHTKRMLRHKTMIQGYRVAFGFSGIKDDDEAARIATEGTGAADPVGRATLAARAREALTPTPPTPEAQEEPETAPVTRVDEVTGEVFDAQVDAIVDGAEYDPVTDTIEDAEIEEEEELEPAPRATKQQVAAINAAARNNKWSQEGFELLLTEYGVEKPAELSRDDALQVVRHLMAGEGAEEQEEMET